MNLVCVAPVYACVALPVCLCVRVVSPVCISVVCISAVSLRLRIMQQLGVTKSIRLRTAFRHSVSWTVKAFYDYQCKTIHGARRGLASSPPPPLRRRDFTSYV